MFAKDLVNQYNDVARLTGLCDQNPGRLEWAKKEIGVDIPCYTNFDEMLDNEQCDTVIVATSDSTHHHFIIKAMERGKDVITEKPMTVDGTKCVSILEAEKRTNKKVRVTFNCRYSPYKAKVKELLLSGIVGDIHSVEFKWHLDTVHGADYFRRWHRQKQHSGGLLVHKSTHHFDMINWWLDLEPVEVAAMGSRHYYVPERKPNHGKRCLTCSIKKECEFYLDISNNHSLKQVYLDNEKYDGYYRDLCLFDEEINIEDTISAMIRYPKGVQVSYCLTAATSFEGWQAAFNGSKGRLEAIEPEAFIIEEDQSNFQSRSSKNSRRRIDWRTVTSGESKELETNEIRFYPLFGGVKTYHVPTEEGGHGGADRRLKDDLFTFENSKDPLGQCADSRAGAMSLLIGAAANKSIEENRFVKIEELLRN